jgi:UrcA family protein
MTMTSLIRKAASTTLTLALLSPLASLAQPISPAKGVDGPPAVSVNYGDLDLSRPAALEVLFKRLKSAAKTVCAQFDSVDLARRRLFDACVDQAIAGAVIQTKVPALAALYTEKTGNKLAANPLLTAHR